ncbi:MAG: glutamine synthetase beta-grasp domain-containing protein [Bradymonadales bacterium]|nr:glutamine synthetase beta-grasp domain-containing protein [Bradymonadales bacterium]
MFSSIDETMIYLREQGVEQVDLKVSDLVGRWRRMTYPASHITERLFHEGTGTSLSPYPGYRTVDSGDMRIVPDVSTAFIDPFHSRSTIAFLCDLYHNDGQRYGRDPRYVAAKAEDYLDSLDLGGQVVFSPELEFYLFDRIEYGSSPSGAHWSVESPGAGWGPETDSIYRLRTNKGGQIDQPLDRFTEVREQMVLAIQNANIPVKYHHHELGAAGQTEIEIFFHPLVKTGDVIQTMKYLVKNLALSYGFLATFMPKPLPNDAGNGMHFHQYLTDGERSLFYDPAGYSGLNKLALSYLAGQLHHTPALMGLGNASTNSYRRFAPSMAAPIKLFFATGNRSSALRVPAYAINERECRIEYRMPDATANPYLILAAQLMAGLKGVQDGYDPTAMGYGPLDVNVFALPKEEQDRLKEIPMRFEDALAALKDDREFLTRGEVFTDDLIDAWIALKIQDEIAAVGARPHPYEFELYLDL